MEFSPEILALLALAAFCAGLIDAIAGGGGLLTVPALLLAGADPVTAVATNKLHGSFGTASATLAFTRAGQIDWRNAMPLAAIAVFSSVLGGLAVATLPSHWLSAVVPVLLVAVALWFALSPRFGQIDRPARVSPTFFALAVVPPIAFYDGFFGPGAGSFYILGFAALMGLSGVRAVAQTKLLNLASNGGALVFFALSGHIVWAAGLAMGLAAFAGAQLGSRLVLKHGAKLIRPLIVIVCLAVAARLMSDPANPLRALIGV
jgi:uncharacterized membrane protein YfcA